MSLQKEMNLLFFHNKEMFILIRIRQTGQNQ